MRGAGDFVKNFDWCDSGPPNPDRVRFFGEDQAGKEIFWGPATQPLWDDDILSSARMIAFGHDKNVHELAMPIALTGLEIGRARGAGLGAAISRAYRNTPFCENGNRPHSYVLMPSDIGMYRGISASILATGLHGGANRPVELKIGPEGLGDLFANAEPSDVSAAALQALRDQYQQRLRWQGNPGNPVRSPQFDDYRSSFNTLENSSALDPLLGGNVLQAELGQSCQSTPKTGMDYTGKALDVAAILLNPDQGNARYVGVMDRGFETYAGAPYDTHNKSTQADTHVPQTLTNLYHCLSKLRTLIDSGAIDLDDTLVVLTTEMGRNPSLGAYNGREHWTQGTVQVLLGSPGASGIVGTLDDNGYAKPGSDFPENTPCFKSAHARAAVLMAAGVDPVASNSSTFVLGELNKPLSAGSDAELRALIGSEILGV